jgi:hypothetical protein
MKRPCLSACDCQGVMACAETRDVAGRKAMKKLLKTPLEKAVYFLLVIW